VSPARTTGRERGDQARFTRLAETAGPRVLAYLARRVDPPGDAADLLAEVFATAWRRVDDLPADDGEAAAWLFGIARGTLANHRRGQTGAARWRTGCATTWSTAIANRRPWPTTPSPFGTLSAGWLPTTGSCSP
jgi:DNA-directed RNA polymerase specialized sigma24 family protein